MINSINNAQPVKQNNKAVSFAAKFVYDSSVYKPLKDAHDAIDLFNGKTDMRFDAESFLLKLKEGFETATEKVSGTVSISKDDFFEGINVLYKDAGGKRIFSSVPALNFFKKDEPNYVVIANALKKQYEKLFETTCLPESNPFKQ